jgi:hypothetical protein
LVVDLVPTASAFYKLHVLVWYCLEDEIPWRTRASTALNWSPPRNMHNPCFRQSQFCKLRPSKSSCQKPSGPWPGSGRNHQRVCSTKRCTIQFLVCVHGHELQMWLFCFSSNGVYFSGTSHSQESLIANANNE